MRPYFRPKIGHCKKTQTEDEIMVSVPSYFGTGYRMANRDELMDDFILKAVVTGRLLLLLATIYTTTLLIWMAWTYFRGEKTCSCPTENTDVTTEFPDFDDIN